MSFGPRAWIQQHWDVRAALNFMLGGMGAGLMAATALAYPDDPVPVLLSLGLIAAGLAAVWLEIGRKLRAVNVFFNPFTSWMTRESFAALLAFALGAAAREDQQRGEGLARHPRGEGIEEDVDGAQLPADLEPHGGKARGDHAEREQHRRAAVGIGEGGRDHQPRARAAEHEFQRGAHVPVLLDPRPGPEAPGALSQR